VDAAAKDKQRYDRESREADRKYELLQRAKRENRVAKEGEDFSGRKGRANADAERAIRQAKEQQRALNRANREETEEEAELREAREKQRAENKIIKDKADASIKLKHLELQKEEKKNSKKRLEYLLSQSDVFRKLNMGFGDASNDSDASAPPPSPTRRSRVAPAVLEEDEDAANDDECNAIILTKQPSVIEFGEMKPYQITGLNWMIHLKSKGLSGILADEMGLGKTLQSISVLAYMWEYERESGPSLIVVPKSTISNWMNELERWCPSLRAAKFHGAKEERAEFMDTYFTDAAISASSKRPDLPQIPHPTKPNVMIDDNSKNPRKFDVLVTTYEICNMEQSKLSKFGWSYLIIDEAHRLKNEASQFANTVRSMRTRNRLLLTGTPLQNNLHELWALLNFILPDIFASAEQFDEWFDLDNDDADAKKEMISTLHKVLRPFMLRRLKVDVAKGLPPKTETLLMVGMSSMQKQLYKKLLLRDIDALGSNGKNGTSVVNILMQLRKCCGHPYLFEGVEDRNLPALGEHLVDNCGKFVLMDKLLKRLKEKGHRVLIFTQMTRILDIIEDYMVFREHNYCRIDGNTDYEAREESIDAFNKPGSDKFCFILSTRAGGLGINLQTADTVILFDSDWNPQADLQAQDRAHRLGQTRPVSVYRLVTENSVEEKIVERAQQKLKLDAMVVQSGRLKEKDKVSKEEIMAAIKFGADTVFRSENSDITDDDIDAILARGAEKTKEMASKLEVHQKGDLLDFSFDGGMNYQSMDGVDYSDKEFRDHLKLMSAETMGKRERKQTTIMTQDATATEGSRAVVKSQKFMMIDNKLIQLPSKFRLPRMEAHQFFNQKRLLELSELEFESFAALRANGTIERLSQLDHIDSCLPEDMAEEKARLLSEGFRNLSRRDYYKFVKGVVAFGRENLTEIANSMNMSLEVVSDYSARFWSNGRTALGEKEWTRVLKQIETGEEKVRVQDMLKSHLTDFLAGFENPRKELYFANRTRAQEYATLEQDRAILVAVDKFGYGQWEAVQREMRNDDNLLFSHGVQATSVDKINRRADHRLRQLEKELDLRKKADTLKEEQIKKRKDGEAKLEMFAAVSAIEAGDTSVLANMQDGMLKGDVETEVENRKKLRAQWGTELRAVDKAVSKQLAKASAAKDAILAGEQHVNLSEISLKGDLADMTIISTTTATGSKVQSVSGAATFDTFGNPLGKKRGRVAMAAGGTGNRRKPTMTDELFVELAQAIGVFGGNERKKIVEDFTALHAPDWTEKDANEWYGKLSVRKQPACVPKHVKSNLSREKPWFYLRPAFYKFLSAENGLDKVEGWEQAMAEDRALFDKEEENKKATAKNNKEKEKNKKKKAREEFNLKKYGTAQAPKGKQALSMANAKPAVALGGDSVSQEGDVSIDVSMDMGDDMVVDAEVLS
jgi:SWI/SNF-related matrix-associated actin-dependent regulator of chromatin subfamily A member 5